jgi:hypothetical protein
VHPLSQHTGDEPEAAPMPAVQNPLWHWLPELHKSPAPSLGLQVFVAPLQ